MLKDKLLGAFIGLAVGDAIGTTVEFRERDTFDPVTDMVGKGPFNLPVGYWTDDTSMALCLAESLIANPELDKTDLLERFADWNYNGANSSTGRCFDIGNTTRTSIANFKRTGETVNNPEFFSAGNGSIMRLSPAVIAHYDNEAKAIETAVLQSETTHAAPACLHSCELMAEVLLNAIYANEKERIFNATAKEHWVPEVKSILNTMGVDRDHVSSSGYVIHTLHAALWCVYQTDNFKDAVLLAVNLGDDADTVGAVTGQIAGAFYGLSGIPDDWKIKLHDFSRFVDLTEDLIKR